MQGGFTHAGVRTDWTFGRDRDDDRRNGGKQWVLQVRVVDFSVSRRYDVSISQIEAERQARKIEPLLLSIADAWLK